MDFDGYAALRVRNLIAAREFNAADANRELEMGGWRWDHALRDRELGEEIDTLLARNSEGCPVEKETADEG